MEDANDYGVVYVLTNPVMPGLVKIGMTKRTDVEQRMREFNGYSSRVMVEVVGEKKVRYNGQEMSLTAVTKQIMGVTKDLQPTGFWNYKNENLKDLYEKTFKEGNE